MLLAGLFKSFACLNDPTHDEACQTVPGLSTDGTDSVHKPLLLDVGDIAGLIFPAQLYPMWGLSDVGGLNDTPAGTTTPCSQSAFAAARSVYNALQIPGNLVPSTFSGDPVYSPIQGMHHEIDNTRSLRFLSRSAVFPDDQLDYGTQCDGMHCCPPGKAIAGLFLPQDRYICRDIISPANETCVRDTGNQRAGMHACPAGSYMRGQQPDNNWLECCKDRNLPNGLPLNNEAVDTGTTAQGMHTCPSNRRFMTGIHIGNDQLLCDNL